MQNVGQVSQMRTMTYTALQETEYLLGSPANAAHLAKAMRDLAAGRGMVFNPLKRAKRASVSANQPGTSPGVSI